MDKIFYTSAEMPQRSEQWLSSRMGVFTSSDIYNLFTDAPNTKKVQDVLSRIQKNHTNSIGKQKEVFDEKEALFAAKNLGLSKEDAKEAALLLKGAKFFNEIATFLYYYENTHCFSDGGNTLILEKAIDAFFLESKPSVSSFNINRGIEDEFFAIAEYMQRTGFEQEDISFIEWGDTATSPDFVSKDKISLAEFKCPTWTNHFKNIKDVKNGADLLEKDPNYWWQVQHQMYVSGIEINDYCSYCKELQYGDYSKLALHIVPIEYSMNAKISFEEIIPKAVELRDELYLNFVNNL